MGARSSGREAALQMLFALDAAGGSVDRVIVDYWREHPGQAEGREYGDRLVRGVRGDTARLDDRISKASENWRLERMTRVDRNALRIGVWELLEEPNVPVAVVLDEVVELSKRFGTGDSGAFVNGVLARAAEDLGRKTAHAAGER